MIMTRYSMMRCTLLPLSNLIHFFIYWTALNSNIIGYKDSHGQEQIDIIFTKSFSVNPHYFHEFLHSSLPSQLGSTGRTGILQDAPFGRSYQHETYSVNSTLFVLSFLSSSFFFFEDYIQHDRIVNILLCAAHQALFLAHLLSLILILLIPQKKVCWQR